MNYKLQRYLELFYWFRWCFPWKPLGEAKFKEALSAEGIHDYALTDAQVHAHYVGVN